MNVEIPLKFFPHIIERPILYISVLLYKCVCLSWLDSLLCNSLWAALFVIVHPWL